MLGLAPDYVTFNGRAAQYAEHPIAVEPNELIRMYVVNAGPDRSSSFHVVGVIFSQVFNDGSMTAARSAASRSPASRAPCRRSP